MGVKVVKGGVNKRVYDIVDTETGKVLEGGFFTKDAAEKAAAEYRAGTRNL